MFFNDICCCVRTAEGYACTCQRCLQKVAQCGHTLYARWLENDPDVVMPAKQAMVTLENLRARMKAAEGKKRLAHDAFNGPPPERKRRKCVDARESKLHQVVKNLASKDNFMLQFTGLRAATQIKVTKTEASVKYGELDQRCIGDVVKVIFKNSNSPPHSKALAERLGNAWWKQTRKQS